jgi:hypothetical protein
MEEMRLEPGVMTSGLPPLKSFPPGLATLSPAVKVVPTIAESKPCATETPQVGFIIEPLIVRPLEKVDAGDIEVIVKLLGATT